MDIDYVIGFRAGGISGKRKATAEKISALVELGANVRVIERYECGFGVLDHLFLEFRYLVNAIFRDQDIILCRSQFMFGCVLISLIKNVPIYYEIHADAIDENRVLYKKWVRRVMANCVAMSQLYFYRRASGLIFNNEVLEKYFRHSVLPRGTGGPRMLNSPNGADVKLFEVEGSDDSSDVSHPWSGREGKMCLFVGSVSEWHGVDGLVRAFNVIDQMCEEEAKPWLVIAGGANASELSRLKAISSSKRIVFLGAVEPHVARALMRQAHIALLPVADIRRSPGSPLKLYEYLASGLHVIAQENTVGYSDEVLKSGGSVCDFAGDPSRAAELILNLCNSEYDREKISEYARNTCDWTIRMRLWLDFFAGDLRKVR